MSRMMLLNGKNLPNHDKIWAYAVNEACYLRNRVFSTGISNESKNSYEILLNKNPDLSHVRIFGSKAYGYIPKERRTGKFAERARIGFIVAFDRANSYLILRPDDWKTVVSRDLELDEDKLHGLNMGDSDTQGDPQDDDTQSNDLQKYNDKDHVDDDYLEQVIHYPQFRRSCRAHNPLERLGYHKVMFIQQACMKNYGATTPLTFKGAVSGPNKEEWKSSMDEEMQQFDQMKTWKLVKLLEGARTVKNKWVYFTERDEQQRLERSRARFVAKSFMQQKGIDYDEVFAPVAKYSTFCLNLAFAPQK